MNIRKYFEDIEILALNDYTFSDSIDGNRPVDMIKVRNIATTVRLEMANKNIQASIKRLENLRNKMKKGE